MPDQEKKAAVQAAMSAPITANLAAYSTHVSQSLFRQFPDATWRVKVFSYTEYNNVESSFFGTTVEQSELVFVLGSCIVFEILCLRPLVEISPQVMALEKEKAELMKKTIDQYLMILKLKTTLYQQKNFV